MLDVKFIRENKELVEKSAKEKGYAVDISELIALDDTRKAELVKVEELRKKRNEIAAKMKGGKPDAAQIEAGKAVKAELAEREEVLAQAETKLKAAIALVPNIILSDVPLGDEDCSVEVRKWGEPHETGVDHLDYAVSRDWVDFERGAKDSGEAFMPLPKSIFFGFSQSIAHNAQWQLRDLPHENSPRYKVRDMKT